MTKKEIAVVTGADGGFGIEFVKLLIKEDIAEIWAIARSKEKLGRLVSEYGDKIRIFPMDLTDRSNINKIRDMLNTDGVSVKYLINNAGFAKFCSYSDIGTEESLNMIDLNICAVVALGLVCIPFMESGSHIINISSQASFFPLPYQNIYSSTKAFVHNYTRALNIELKEKGIHATVVCPGWMDTGLFERGIIGAEKGTNNFYGMKKPDATAKKALKDAKKGKDISVYGLYVRFTHIMSKIIPQKIIMKIWLNQQKIK